MTNLHGWAPNGRPPRRHPLRAAGRAARRVLTALSLWQRRRTAIRQLNALPDRALRDIGLDRAEIRATVAAMAHREKRDEAPGFRQAEAPAGSRELLDCC